MFNDKVAPYLSKFSGGTIFSQTVGVFGIPESTVAERLADLLSEANPTVAPYAKDGEVTLRVTARAADTETARTLCAPIVEEIRKEARGRCLRGGQRQPAESGGHSFKGKGQENRHGRVLHRRYAVGASDRGVGGFFCL